MKPRIRAALVPYLLLITLVLQASAAPQSYPLKVRGGGRLRVWGEPTKTPGLVKLLVEFSFAHHSAKTPLRPGEGSWLDRGQRTGEPSRLEYFMQEQDAQRIVDFLRSPANSYTFECYNTGKGYMQVTKAYVKSVRID